jgi:FixJ family two-component response regulator
MDSTDGTIFIIDDDADVRDALSRLLRSAGWGVEAFATAEAFLDTGHHEDNACILLDVAMPGMSGPQLHEHLSAVGVRLPVIYLTGNCTVSIGVHAMKQGAVDFLEKPIDGDALLSVIEQAVARYRTARDEDRLLDEARRCLSQLSAREREVMGHVIRGRLNKQIAADLNIALKTVKEHRGRVMAKMKVRSLAELVRLCDAAARLIGHDQGPRSSVPTAPRIDAAQETALAI